MTEEQQQNRKLIIAYIEDPAKATVLFRVARNRALQIDGAWRAVFIDGSASHSKSVDNISDESFAKLAAVAGKMGGEVVRATVKATKEAASVVFKGEEDKIALLILGATEHHGLFRLRSTIPDELQSHARKKRIMMENVYTSGQSPRYSVRERFRFFRFQYNIYALFTVSIAFMAAFLLRQALPPALFRINNQNIALLFMIACVFSASRWGLVPGLISSLTSYFIINYFFTTPYYHLNIDGVTDLLNMCIFLFAALLMSVFTSRTLGFAEKATRRELSTQVLFNLYRIASDVSSRQEAMEKLQGHLTRTLDMEVAFFMPQLLNPDAIELVFPYSTVLADKDTQALELCWKEAKATGIGLPFCDDSAWRFNPMMAQGGAVGVIGVKPRVMAQVDSWFGSMLMAIADQVATIIEHIDLATTMEATRISEEREKLRSMLLSSVSHDLKTPLSSIIGALNIYRSHAEKIDAKNRSSLIETALGEAERLDSFITNILDMTRLESKKIKFKQSWNDPQLVLQEVIKRLGYRLRNHKIAIQSTQEKTEVYMDYMMTGQVLQNIIDNACKYTPIGTAIELRMLADEENGFFYEVRDHGPGIPQEKMEHIFDKYARLQMRDSQIAGTGLGLAICKTIAEVQGGFIRVANHPEGGAIFSVNIPKWRHYQVANLQAS